MIEIKSNEQKIIISKLMSETSYLDKTYNECEKNINKWLEIIDKIKLPKDDMELLKYILYSRRDNIHILKDHLSGKIKNI